MAEDRDAEDRSLADRLVNYADAIAALMFLGTSGLGIAVADPDIRSTIARGADFVALAYIISGVLFSSILVVLRRWETDLRSDLPPAPKARRYSRYLFWARFAVVWLAAT